MGESAVLLAERGRHQLASMGLDGIEGPGLRAEMCKTCACQPNSVPNGCLQTQMDFFKAAAEGRPFLCHAPKDGRLCAGWVRVRAELVANPLPPRLQALLAEHEFSQPDEAEEGAG
jgi:hypothetical protein